MSRTYLPTLESAMTAEGKATYHVETSPVSALPCWCEMGHDHTMREFFKWLDRIED
jgi:hypothetical protein